MWTHKIERQERLDRGISNPENSTVVMGVKGGRWKGKIGWRGDAVRIMRRRWAGWWEDDMHGVIDRRYSKWKARRKICHEGVGMIARPAVMRFEYGCNEAVMRIKSRGGDEASRWRWNYAVMIAQTKPKWLRDSDKDGGNWTNVMRFINDVVKAAMCLWWNDDDDVMDNAEANV